MVKVKVEHTNVNKSVENVVLNEWILDSFDEESSPSGMSIDPYSRNLEEYIFVFDNEVEQLTNEYEFKIGKKRYILDDIWEKREQVHEGTIYTWHNDRFEKDERLGKSEPWKGEKNGTDILDAELDKLDDDWFTVTINDDSNLDGIVDYFDLKPHDDFIDINDEAYKERICKLLGMTYKNPSPILIEKVEVPRYMIGPGESYTKVRILGIEEMPRTSAKIAAVRAELIKEMYTEGSVQRET
ncbi:hypothetical protein Tco_1381351 [Tanacetum coccineum]